MGAPIECHIYRSKQKQGLYIYLVEKDKFDVIPDALKRRLGKLEFTFSMNLDENKKLARLDATQVLQQLKKEGYFLQMPPSNTNFLDLDLRQSDGF